jgi:hypothetical protein
MEVKPNPEKLYNENWDALLKVFHKIVETNPPNYAEQLQSLKDLAKTKQLSPRQLDGIMARCDNAISGDYGNTKTSTNISQEHNFSSNGKQ